jgi:hypothetical protein
LQRETDSGSHDALPISRRPIEDAANIGFPFERQNVKSCVVRITTNTSAFRTSSAIEEAFGSGKPFSGNLIAKL